ncbi:type I-E CRISPR-associated protein Cse2/CasB [Streptomyces violascens]|uniref:type I-E CRISPR-associated protein Cse2/CasB n=1 Tax=Streptomyces violascens TaxID=67381 RepID=UPI0036C6625B
MPSRDEYRLACDRFVDAVRELCATPAARYALEAGHGRPVDHCPGLHKYLSSLVKGRPARHAHYTVASLIAQQRPDPEHPDSDCRPGVRPAWSQRLSLGAALARSAGREPPGSPMERELQILVRLQSGLLHRRLHLLHPRLLQAGHPPDPARLLDDLIGWEFNRPAVRTRWLDAFYCTPEPEPELPPSPGDLS